MSNIIEMGDTLTRPIRNARTAFYCQWATLSQSSSLRFRQVGDEKRAIKGLDDGVKGMKAGGTRRIVVPPEVSEHDMLSPTESKVSGRKQRAFLLVTHTVLRMGDSLVVSVSIRSDSVECCCKCAQESICCTNRMAHV